ncbi:hypothetical protein ACF05T_20095 [Streptomyces lateritius]|uniref:PH domain-containing protein n=1 Tax=Streptomyces lateritius TaxID=67313 RepID=A0ABW6YEZ9_9ACTN
MARTRETVDFRRGQAQDVLPLVVGGVAGLGLLYLALWWDSEPMTAETLRWCAQSGAAGVAALLVIPRPPAARLTADHLVVVTATGSRRRVPWADITRIEVRSGVFGTRQVSVGLVTGECLTLLAPTSFLDRRFDARLRELGAWWETHRHGD